MKKKKNDRILSILIKANVVIILCLVVLTAVLLISKSFGRKPVKVKDSADNNIAALINPDNKKDNEINNSSSVDTDTGEIDENNSDIGDTEESKSRTGESGESKSGTGELGESKSATGESDESKSGTNDTGGDNTDIGTDESEHSEINTDSSNQKADEPTIYTDYDTEKQGWCFARKEDHVPSGTYEPFDISKFDGYFLNKNVSDDDPVIYLAFDCGYEYGYTPKILDILAEHNAKAMFFVTGDFLDTNPELAKRMKDEGHMVGNHTDSHPSLPELSVEDVKKQILSCEKQFKEATGYDMDKFIRPPMGEYSELSMKVTQELGYTTIFWSMAYNDYDVNNQPGKDYVINHFKKYYHNGAITLTHSVSESNTEALGEVLTYLEEQGYRFGTLDELK